MAETHAYAEPHYVNQVSATAILSEVRRITVHLGALTWLNTLLDELLFSTLMSVASHSGNSDSPASPSGLIQLPLTTERYKTAGVLGQYNNALFKGAVLDAELVVRELVRADAAAWKADPALRSTPDVSTPKHVAVKDLFEKLRIEAEALSPLSHAKRAEPGQALSLYCAAILSHVAEEILRKVAEVVMRDPGCGEATAAELLAAMKEDAQLWQCFQTTRTRTYIERELALSRRPTSSKGRRPSTARSHGTQASVESRIDPVLASIVSHPSSLLKRKTSRSSSFSTSARNKKESTARSERELELVSLATAASSGSSIEEPTVSPDEFESLLAGRATMKVSLTPNRLKSMELLNKNKTAERKVSTGVLNVGESAFSKPKGSSPTAAPAQLPPLPVVPAAAPSTSSTIRARRFQPRAATRDRAEADEEDDEEGKKESLADFFASDPSPPRAPASDGLVGASADDRADMEAKIAANRARRLAKQQSQEAELPLPPVQTVLMPRSVSQPASIASSKPGRKRLVAKEAAPRDTSTRDLFDFLASGPDTPPQSSDQAVEYLESRKSGVSSLGGAKKSIASLVERAVPSPPRSPTFGGFKQRFRTGTNELPDRPESRNANRPPSRTSVAVPALVTGFTTGPRNADAAPFMALQEDPRSPALREPLPPRSSGSSSTITPAQSIVEEARHSIKHPSASESRMVNGLMTPASSIDSIAAQSARALSPIAPTLPLRSDTPPPPTPPMKVRRKAVPSHVPSEGTAELLQTPDDGEEGQPVSPTSPREITPVVEEATPVVEKSSTYVAPAAPVLEEPLSELARALLVIRARMAVVSPEEQLAVLDEAILALPPADPAKLVSDLVEMEARMVEAFLDGDAYKSMASSMSASGPLPPTPSLTDETDDERDVDEVQSPEVGAKELHYSQEVEPGEERTMKARPESEYVEGLGVAV